MTENTINLWHCLKLSQNKLRVISSMQPVVISACLYFNIVCFFSLLQLSEEVDNYDADLDECESKAHTLDM